MPTIIFLDKPRHMEPTLNFTNFLFRIYIIKAIKEMAVCIVALDCVQNDENLELTALNGWRRYTQSNMGI